MAYRLDSTNVVRDFNNTTTSDYGASDGARSAPIDTRYDTTLLGQSNAPPIEDYALDGRNIEKQIGTPPQAGARHSKLTAYFKGNTATRTLGEQVIVFEQLAGALYTGQVGYDDLGSRPAYQDDMTAVDALWAAGCSGADIIAVLKLYSSNKEMVDDLKHHGLLAEGKAGVALSPKLSKGSSNGPSFKDDGAAVVGADYHSTPRPLEGRQARARERSRLCRR
jgi:hypothetical protein